MTNKKVLICEDEPHLVEALSFVLEREGFAVSAVLDAAGLLPSLRGQRPDVLILDVMLPGASGFELLRQIRADPALAGVAVMILTAKGQLQDRRTAEEIGADAFMTKPFSNHDVVEQVRRLTQR